MEADTNGEKMKLKTYLLLDDSSKEYCIGRRTESQLKPEIIKDMCVGEMRQVGDGMYIQREK